MSDEAGDVVRWNVSGCPMVMRLEDIVSDEEGWQALYAELQKLRQDVTQLRDDRARLCEVILRNPCRPALVDLVESLTDETEVFVVDQAIEAAKKALRDTEGQ